MQLSELELNKSVAQLSVRDLIGIISAANKGTFAGNNYFTTENWIGGTAKLAKFLHLSKATISRRLKDGDFDGCFLRNGNTYWFNKEKICNILNTGLMNSRTAR